ncbi:hypothetical protein NM208_g1666 [Fusarium decemcellulare]|uniref:Uncharacterized protein n=1 Tax=Fusarium decemcellulare TaxID=57161 RepID=A0ACC1SVC0_9HYPO|nr:hypothetical protein NM208_g1666 [Fusarium decemcellulare]
MAFDSNVKRERAPLQKARKANASQQKASESSPSTVPKNSRRERKGENRIEKMRQDLNISLHQMGLIDSWINPENDTDLESDEHYSVRLKTGQEDRNIIHQTISELQKNQIGAPANALEYIEAIPMVEASKSQSAILFRIIDLLIPQRLLQTMTKRCQEEQKPCPLRAVAKGRLEQCYKRNSAGVNKIRPTVGEHSVPPGESCLHDLINVDALLRQDQELREILEKSLELHPQCLHFLIEEAKFDPGQKDNSQLISLDSFKSLLELLPDTVFNSTLPNGRYSPLQMAVQLFSKQSIDYKLLFDAIKALVERHPQSIFFKGGRSGNLKTAYHLFQNTKSKENAEWQSRAEELLKTTCIGAREIYDEEHGGWMTENLREKKNEFLYSQVALEKRFFLNLDGESAMLNEDYISTMFDKSGMRFESVLEFVKLPYWNPADRKPQSKLSVKPPTHGTPISTTKQQGAQRFQPVEAKPDPYKYIFRYLWESGVHKIFTVEVEDDGPAPHTNAAIREALRGTTSPGRSFDIEVWKWKKFDICSETIFAAAPKAREVHLFSRANTAVLRGWASESGLVKLKELEELTIEIFPTNRDDEQDCKDYEQELKNSLTQRCDKLTLDKIQVAYPNSQSIQTDTNTGTAMDPAARTQQSRSQKKLRSKEWITELQEFREFVLNLDLGESRPPVKIALLDDGCKLTGLHGKQIGKSFRADGQEYFVGDCEHGTQMACCIREVCPMAELYIARLDDSRDVENQKFTIASCHEALQWALEMDVDIISMSWTFKRKGAANDEHEKRFAELISESKVILFGALPDKGPTLPNTQFAPVGLDNVIRIASATTYGETSKDNIHATIDFLLPGEDLEIKPGNIVCGSSYATAYAAGLAAVVLYCIKASQQINGEDKQDKLLALAKTKQGMSNIFCYLGQKQPRDKTDAGIFLMPYHKLKGDFYTEPKEEILENILGEIMPKSERLQLTL